MVNKDDTLKFTIKIEVDVIDLNGQYIINGDWQLLPGPIAAYYNDISLFTQFTCMR